MKEENKKTLEDSFERMKLAFETTLLSNTPDIGNDIDATMILEIVRNHSLPDASREIAYDVHMDTRYNNLYWLIYARSTHPFVFVWNTDINKGKYISLNYESGPWSIEFIKDTHMLLVQFANKTQLMEFEPKTIEIIYDETFLIPKEELQFDFKSMYAIDTGNTQHVFLYSDSLHSIGILDIHAKKLVFTDELLWGNHKVWTYSNVLVVKTINGNNKQSILVFITIDNTPNKLFYFEGKFIVNEVTFNYVSEENKLFINFIVEGGKSNYSLILPLRPKQ